MAKRGIILSFLCLILPMGLACTRAPVPGAIGDALRDSQPTGSDKGSTEGTPLPRKEK